MLRKLAQYKAADERGILVKGASLLNYTTDSVEKTIRKPIETLAYFKKASKVKLRTFLKDLSTLDIPVGGKLNEHHIIKGYKMLIYLDTEFTDLIPDNKLISIALVDENEEYFYAELTDTYELSDCSDFVKEHVIPFLRGGSYRMTAAECSVRLNMWIEDRNVECMLGCDAPSWDIPHVKDLLYLDWPKNLSKNQYLPVYISSDVEEEIVAEFGYRIHNALDDALVMKKAMDLQK